MITPEQEQYLHNYADNIDRYYESIADETLQEQIKHMPASATTQQLINFVRDSIYYGGPQTQYDFRLKTPCTVMVGGKSKSGKTELLFDLCVSGVSSPTTRPDSTRNEFIGFTVPMIKTGELPEGDIRRFSRRIARCQRQQYRAAHNSGLESQQAETAKEEMRDAIVILDDLMDEMTKNDKMSQFFTRESHHRNLCMFFVWQDIFPKHKHGSTISKNTDYKIIFDNPSCRDSVRRMLGKMYPKAKQAGEVAQKFSTPSNTAHPIRTLWELEKPLAVVGDPFTRQDVDDPPDIALGDWEVAEKDIVVFYAEHIWYDEHDIIKKNNAVWSSAWSPWKVIWRSWAIVSRARTSHAT
eukprot:gene10608-biopygen7749